MKLKNVKDTLIIIKFGNVEPDNYWYLCVKERQSPLSKDHVICYGNQED